MLPPTATGSVNALNSELSWKKIFQKICSKEELLTQFHLVVVAHTHMYTFDWRNKVDKNPIWRGRIFQG